MSIPQSQSSHESADFGTKYSQIIDYTEQLGNTQEIDLKESFQKINQICSVIEETFRETTTTSDYLLDMNALASTTSAAKNLAKNVNSKIRSFNPIEFAHKLLESYQNDRGILDLPRLHKAGDVTLRRTFCNPILLNSFVPTVVEIEQKKRTVTRRERDAVAEKKTSEKVASVEKTDPSTNEIVYHVQNCLGRCYKRAGERPISYFRFTVDPTSFAKTVENVFHTSFLIRDSRAKMGISSEGTVTIAPCKGKPPGKENGGDGEGEPKKAGTRKQMFVEMTPAQHKDLVRLLNIREAMIPPLTSVPAPLSTVQKRHAVSNSPNVENKHKRR